MIIKDQNPTALAERCIELLGNCIGQVPIIWRKDDDSTFSESEAFISRLDRPEPLDLILSSNFRLPSMRAFFKRVLTYEYYSGGAVLEVSESAGRLISARLFKSSDYIEDSSRQSGKEKIVTFFKNTRTGKRVKAENLYVFSHLTLENLLRVNYILERLAKIFELDNSILQFNSSFFNQGAKISLLILLREPPDKKQIETFKQYYREVSNSGEEHLPLVLGGVEDVKSFGDFIKDIDFLKGKESLKKEICAVFGVPPALVASFEDSNYANAKIQERLMWEYTLVPKIAEYIDVFNNMFLAKYFNNWRIEFDLSEIKALHTNPVDAAPAVQRYRKVGLSFKEISDILNIPEFEDVNEETALSLSKAVTNSQSVSKEDLPLGVNKQPKEKDEEEVASIMKDDKELAEEKSAEERSEESRIRRSLGLLLNDLVYHSNREKKSLEVADILQSLQSLREIENSFSLSNLTNTSRDYLEWRIGKTKEILNSLRENNNLENLNRFKKEVSCLAETLIKLKKIDA